MLHLKFLLSVYLGYKLISVKLIITSFVSIIRKNMSKKVDVFGSNLEDNLTLKL